MKVLAYSGSQAAAALLPIATLVIPVSVHAVGAICGATWYAGNKINETYTSADSACRGYLLRNGLAGYPTVTYDHTEVSGNGAESGALCFAKLGLNSINAYRSGSTSYASLCATCRNTSRLCTSLSTAKRNRQRPHLDRYRTRRACPTKITPLRPRPSRDPRGE